MNKESAVPSGVIVMWSGAVDQIPEGWLLCDGQNGTPDLRDRFIVGAGNAYNVGTAGGAAMHSHAISDRTGFSTLSINEMPIHAHTFVAAQTGANGPYLYGDNSQLINDTTLTTNAAGGSYGHAHSIDMTSAQASNLPPYYALAYIMKLEGGA